MEKNIKNLISEFFEKLNIKIDKLNVTNIDESNIFNVKIETDESGILIGPHGKNLNTIESILKLMCSKKVNEKIKLHLEINDYIASKDDRLFSFIKSKISYLQKNGKDIQLPFYSSYERKKIHGFVSDLENKSIYTKSIGEGKDRRLYICKQDQKLTIDIDGYDI